MGRLLINRCRSLRKDQTDAEGKFWSILRDRKMLGIKFRRQYSTGRYILDFYSPKCRLGIEADGGHHYVERKKELDEQRTKVLNHYGIKILRFGDNEILTNIEGVCEVIQRELKGCLPPSP